MVLNIGPLDWESSALHESQTGSFALVSDEIFHQFKNKSGTHIVARLENALSNHDIETQSL